MSNQQRHARHGHGHDAQRVPVSDNTPAHESTRGTIRHTVIVLSGKGGVGKSTVAVNLAVALSDAGRKVGLLDADLHGPSIPAMLGLQNAGLTPSDAGARPAYFEGLAVVSIGFLLEDADSPVIWRGPAKAGVIKQLVEEVAWGELDYLVVDCPPGTGDEPLSVIQILGQVDGAVVVTTPQEVALADVRKSIRFCETLEVPVLGVVENMSGFACPHCGEVVNIFKSGGGEEMAADMEVPFLGRLPMDPQLVRAGDDGTPFIQAYQKSPAALIMAGIVQQIVADCEKNTVMTPEKETTMRFAIPLAEGRLCLHFGHCEQFALVDVDAATKKITGTSFQTPPPHEPGVIPRWLHEQGATTIIAGGMGSRAQTIFAEQGIAVVCGAPVMDPEALVTTYLDGTLVAGVNTCDH